MELEEQNIPFLISSIVKRLLLNRTVTIMLLCGCSFKGISQDKLDNNLIYEHQVKFSFSPVLYDNLKINNQGVRHFGSRPSFSGEISVSYYHHIKNGYGINVGIGLGLAPFNMNYYFKSPDNSIYQTGGYDYLDLTEYEYANYLKVFPVSIQKIFLTKNKNLFLSVDLGIKFNSLYSYPYEILWESTYYIDEVNTAIKLFDFYIEDTGKQHLISYFIKLGLVKINEKQNTFHCNLVVNYSPDRIGKGWYRFDNLSYDSFGTVEQNINYIGLEFAYGLALSRRLKNKY